MRHSKIRTASLTACFCVVALMIAGCAHGEYDVVRPPDLAQHIGDKQFVTLAVDPIEYQMIAYQDHLIVRAYNRTTTAIQLLADQSTVVDPGGQSHPVLLRDQTILPGSYVKVVLPPVRPRLEPTGPTIGIGFGTVIGYGRPWRGRHYYPYGYGFGYDPFYFDTPRYYALYGGDEENLYWRWRDGGEVRVVLNYRGSSSILSDSAPAVRAGTDGPETRPLEHPDAQVPQTMTHEFVFVQKRV